MVSQKDLITSGCWEDLQGLAQELYDDLEESKEKVEELEGEVEEKESYYINLLNEYAHKMRRKGNEN